MLIVTRNPLYLIFGILQNFISFPLSFVKSFEYFLSFFFLSLLVGRLIRDKEINERRTDKRIF